MCEDSQRLFCLQKYNFFLGIFKLLGEKTNLNVKFLTFLIEMLHDTKFLLHQVT